MRRLFALLLALPGAAFAADAPTLTQLQNRGAVLGSMRVGATCAPNRAEQEALTWVADRLEAEYQAEVTPHQAATIMAMAQETIRRPVRRDQCATLHQAAARRGLVWLHLQHLNAELRRLEAERARLLREAAEPDALLQ